MRRRRIKKGQEGVGNEMPMLAEWIRSYRESLRKKKIKHARNKKVGKKVVEQKENYGGRNKKERKKAKGRRSEE